MMLLRGRDSEFELGLIEDHFPDPQDDAGSAWWTLSFRVGTPSETWEETAPCMNIYELHTLLDWMDAVADGNPDVAEVELLEPELRFSIVRDNGQEVTIRISFHLENRPDRFALDAPTDQDHVDLRLGRDQVRVAAAELRRDLASIAETSGTVRGRTRRREDTSGILGNPEEDLGLIAEDIASHLDESDDERMF